MKTKKRRKIETSGIIIIAVILITIVAIMLLKYNVEGETDMPYVVKKMVVISTANGTNSPNAENKWNISINQNTDIYFDIERNTEHKSTENIRNIKIQNIQITGTEHYTPKAYMPSAETEAMFNYTENNIIQGELAYEVDKDKDTQNKKITTEGGIIAISFCNPNIATYTGNEDKMTYDGTLLNKVGITLEQIKATIKFDLVLETASGKKYKAEINLQTPSEDITQTGIVITEDTELKNIVFKRTN